MKRLRGKCTTSPCSPACLRVASGSQALVRLIIWVPCPDYAARSDRKIKSISLADSYKIVRFVGHGILNRAKVHLAKEGCTDGKSLWMLYRPTLCYRSDHFKALQEGAKRAAKSPALAAGFQQPVEIDDLDPDGAIIQELCGRKLGLEVQRLLVKSGLLVLARIRCCLPLVGSRRFGICSSSSRAWSSSCQRSSRGTWWLVAWLLFHPLSSKACWIAQGHSDKNRSPRRWHLIP